MAVSGQLHAPAALPLGKEPWYPLHKRLGGPHIWSGRGGGEKNSQPLPGLETPTIHPVAQRYTIEIYRLIMYTFLQAVSKNLLTICDIRNFSTV
jgi:hypothetical protein